MTGFNSGRCTANGIDIHYLRTGGGAPSLVLLHGLTGSGACWTPVARALDGDDDVVMPDARGHGQSGKPYHGYGYADLAGDVIGLIAALGLSAPVLAGHSMGGLTAAVAACRIGSGLRGLVLIDPTFISLEWQRDVHESDVAEQHRRVLASGKTEIVEQLRLRHPKRSAEMIDLIADARLATTPSAFDVLAPSNPEYRGLIREIQAPILLVLGERGVVSLDTARELQALNPRLRHEMIPDVGHGLVYDRPDLLAGVIAGFLRSLPMA